MEQDIQRLKDGIDNGDTTDEDRKILIDRLQRIYNINYP